MLYHNFIFLFLIVAAPHMPYALPLAQFGEASGSSSNASPPSSLGAQ